MQSSLSIIVTTTQQRRQENLKKALPLWPKVTLLESGSRYSYAWFQNLHLIKTIDLRLYKKIMHSFSPNNYAVRGFIVSQMIVNCNGTLNLFLPSIRLRTKMLKWKLDFSCEKCFMKPQHITQKENKERSNQCLD